VQHIPDLCDHLSVHTNLEQGVRCIVSMLGFELLASSEIVCHKKNEGKVFKTDKKNNE
jgi:hypothetical protein